MLLPFKTDPKGTAPKADPCDWSRLLNGLKALGRRAPAAGERALREEFSEKAIHASGPKTGAMGGAPFLVDVGFGEQTIRVVGFQPKHDKQTCEMFAKNNHELVVLDSKKHNSASSPSNWWFGDQRLGFGLEPMPLKWNPRKILRWHNAKFGLIRRILISSALITFLIRKLIYFGGFL